MAHEESVRKSAQAMLLLGYRCDEVARTLLVPVSTVKRWRKSAQAKREQIERKLFAIR